MLNVVAMAGMALSLLAAPAPMELTSAPTEKVTVEVQTVNGSGCPAGSATVRARADNTAFVVSYNDFLAYAGGGANMVESRKNCQINVRVHVPQGFTYAIAQAEYRGFAHLAAGATAQQIAHYYFSGQSATADSAHSFAGPLTTLWKTVDSADVAALVYAPCGADANLNINTELRVDAGNSKSEAVSIIGMDSTRGSVETLFNLSWKKC